MILEGGENPARYRSGAGFAVVADEVRNLAMRVAEAANNTTSLIEDTVQKIKDRFLRFHHQKRPKAKKRQYLRHLKPRLIRSNR